MKKLLLIAILLSSSFLNAQGTYPIDTSKSLNNIQPITINVDSILKLKPYTEITPMPYSIWPYDWSHIGPITVNFFPYIVSESLYNKKGAKKDIKANKMKVLFQSGQTFDFKGETDKTFQKKYEVEFFAQAKDHITEKEDEKGYNQTVFAFLDEKYGTEWRFEIRRDAIGFEIADSLIDEKVQAMMNVIPVLAITHADQWPKGEERVSIVPFLSGSGWIYLAILVFSLVVIFFIFRRK